VRTIDPAGNPDLSGLRRYLLNLQSNPGLSVSARCLINRLQELCGSLRGTVLSSISTLSRGGIDHPQESLYLGVSRRLGGGIKGCFQPPKRSRAIMSARGGGCMALPKLGFRCLADVVGWVALWVTSNECMSSSKHGGRPEILGPRGLLADKNREMN
jgi:hypothetical protein